MSAASGENQLTAKKGWRRVIQFLRRGQRGGSRSPVVPDVQVAVVGAGVAGLTCARALSQAGIDVRVYESSDDVGGRVRTDVVDGFLLDRGFQVFIEEYPEVRRQLDYEALNLKRFEPGALVRCDGGLHLVSDPLRRPGEILRALVAPVGNVADKIKVGLFRLSIAGQSLESIFGAREVTTKAFLSEILEIGPQMIDRFFTPFYRGIFLAPLEEQSSTMFQFVFKMFADGAASLPEAGMGEITHQLAAGLPPGAVLLNSPVLQVIPGAMTTMAATAATTAAMMTAPPVAVVESGTGGGGGAQGSLPQLLLAGGVAVTCGAVVVATEAPAAAVLLAGFPGAGATNVAAAAVSGKPGRSSACLYYALPSPPPVTEPLLILNGEGVDNVRRPANNVVFLDSVAPSYAPSGSSLASVTVVGDAADAAGGESSGGGNGDGDGDLEARVRWQMAEWFGEAEVAGWRHLRTYRIPYAQPSQAPPNTGGFDKPAALGGGVFCCGDHRATATLNGAVRSGVRAAEAVAQALATGEAVGVAAAALGAAASETPL